MISYIRHSHVNNTSSGLPLYEFQIESDADAALLPTTTDEKEYPERCCAGSVAYTPDLNIAFTLSASGVWVKATEN
jgi:hypothetical protein